MQSSSIGSFPPSRPENTTCQKELVPVIIYHMHPNSLVCCCKHLYSGGTESAAAQPEIKKKKKGKEILVNLYFQWSIVPSEGIQLKENTKVSLYKKVFWVFGGVFFCKGGKMIIEFVTEQFPKQTMLFSSYGSLDIFFLKAQNGFPVLSERYIVFFDR